MRAAEGLGDGSAGPMGTGGTEVDGAGPAEVAGGGPFWTAYSNRNTGSPNWKPIQEHQGIAEWAIKDLFHVTE